MAVECQSESTGKCDDYLAIRLILFNITGQITFCTGCCIEIVETKVNTWKWIRLWNYSDSGVYVALMPDFRIVPTLWYFLLFILFPENDNETCDILQSGPIKLA
jgi:hypothetical protein